MSIPDQPQKPKDLSPPEVLIQMITGYGKYRVRSCNHASRFHNLSSASCRYDKMLECKARFDPLIP
jgi:hypothetical protein